jgi:peroxiredoxin Q/BCP
VIRKGDAAPDFFGELGDGTTLRAADFRGKRHLIVYFFPKDFTPG